MIPRGTPEWREAQRGCVSASDAAALMAGDGTKLRAQLLDRMVLAVRDGEGLETEEFPAPWTDTHELDLLSALAAYRKWAREPVEAGGLLRHPNFTWLVASPHALVGEHGIAHFRPRHTLRAYHRAASSSVTRAIRARVQLTLYVAAREWCDVVEHWCDTQARVPDKISVRRLPIEPEWLQTHVFPRLVALWGDVRAALDQR